MNLSEPPVITLSSRYKAQFIYSLCFVFIKSQQYSSPSCSISIPFLIVTVLPAIIVAGTIHIQSSQSEPTDIKK